MTKNLKRDLELLYEIGFYRFKARTWEHFLGIDFANHSEHSFRVAWIAIIIAQHEGVKNIGKIVKMALIHDLSESRSVDVHYLSRQYAKRLEKKAINASLQDTSIKKEFLKLWQEYEERKSIESKIVKDADNLDVDLELKEQEEKGVKLGQHWHEMRQHVAKTKLYTDTAKKLWDEIQTSNPHDWHINGETRRKSGDWKE